MAISNDWVIVSNISAMFSDVDMNLGLNNGVDIGLLVMPIHNTTVMKLSYRCISTTWAKLFMLVQD